ncbi:hypothetical protein RM531_00135 [Salinisphaera sp. P385]|uniref:Uncharacterized protein n=1 Tax=Spectribacter acetivorans TaxID=3075603 RepID=A0ABU3B336_9GAMM|nr:hypothetical protein [Salinisphaera sp. P385]MDT0616869.1 hypothetical protein [Salinisphaera sp. P385]
MTNLTITIDAETLQQARVRAMAEGRSVNALLREYLEAYSGRGNTQREAMADLLALARASDAGSGGQCWQRDELHER